METLNCAVIGCGRIGCSYDDLTKDKTIRTHCGAYRDNKNAKLIALCDIDKKKLEKYGRKFRIKNTYTKTQDMYKNEKIDCVSICTLVDSHLKLVEEAVKNGVKGIFLEKPISDSLKNAKKIIEICKKNKVVLIIDHQRRFDPFYYDLKSKLNEGEYGKIQLVNVYYGRGVANAGSHLFDMLRFLFGEIKSIKGEISKNPSNNKYDPNIDVEIEFSNKKKARMQALDASNFGLFEMDIINEKGRIRIDFVSNKVEFFSIPKTNFLDSKNLMKVKYKGNNPDHSAITYGVKNLVNCIMKKEKPLCTGMDGYRSLELIIASKRSAQLGKQLNLPLKIINYKINSR